MTEYLITEYKALCPYCNAVITLLIDASIDEQSYIEDCEVCCRPMTVRIDSAQSPTPSIQLLQENDIV